MNENVPQERISISSYMDKVESRFDELRKMLSELEGILDPYMIPSNLVESKSQEDPPDSVFFKRLKALNSRIGEAILDIDGIIRRLQL